MLQRKKDRQEAASLMRATLSALLAAAAGADVARGADLRRACGALAADAEIAIGAGAIGDRVRACFDLAIVAGVTLDGEANVRAVLLAQPANSGMALVVRELFLRMCLALVAEVIADTTFDSRSDVDVLLPRVNADFQSALDVASDSGEQDAYTKLAALYAAVLRDLTVRAQPLPEIVTYSFAIRRPALWIANRLYGDGGRSAELVAQNRPVHPLFMPVAGRALSQ